MYVKSAIFINKFFTISNMIVRPRGWSSSVGLNISSVTLGIGPVGQSCSSVSPSSRSVGQIYRPRHQFCQPGRQFCRSAINTNPYKMEPKSIQNRWKCTLGAFSASGRAKVGSMWRLQYEKTRLLESLWAEKGRFKDKCSALWKLKGIQNHTFKDGLARGPSKNVLWEGFFGKSMKIHWNLDRKMVAF